MMGAKAQPDPWDKAAAEAGVTVEHARREAQAYAKMLNPLLDDDDALDDGAAVAQLSDSLTRVTDELLQTEQAQAAQQVYQQLLTRTGEAQPRPRIEPVRRFAELAGMPQASYPIIQVAGTNGKTSTSRMIASLLRAQGLRVGLFTSPHLVHFTERFEIDGEPINGTDLALAWHSLQPALEVVDAELKADGQGPITFFEALAVLAFAAFADAPVEVAVIEVGLGGQWDATNIATAEVAVFTPIALDHTHLLGDTVEQIAATKARILKPGTLGVSAAQDPAALAALRSYAAEVGAELCTVTDTDGDFVITANTQAVGGRMLSLTSHRTDTSYVELAVPLLGEHQGHNAALAVAATEVFLGRALDLEVATAGLAAATSPGRLQLLGSSPTVLVDAAHNPHGVAALRQAFAENFSFPGGVCVVAGVLADKDAAGVLQSLAELADSLVLVPVDSPRSLSLEQLAAHAADIEQRAAAAGRELRVSVAESFALGSAEARSWAVAEEDRGVLIAGSVLLAGEALAAAEEW